MSIYTDENDELVISITEWCKNNPLDLSKYLKNTEINGKIGFPGFAGMKHSDETKKIISEHSKGKNNGMYGKKHTKVSLEKIKKARKSQVITEEHKNNIGLAIKGRKHTPETIKKISESHRGIKHEEKTKQKLSNISSKGTYTFISPDGKEHFHHSIIQFAKEHELSHHLLYSFVNKGKINVIKKGQLSQYGMKTLDWEIKLLHLNHLHRNQ